MNNNWLHSQHDYPCDDWGDNFDFYQEKKEFIRDTKPLSQEYSNKPLNFDTYPTNLIKNVPIDRFGNIKFDGIKIEWNDDASDYAPVRPVQSVQQYWVRKLPLMQQSVLFAAIRGPDGIRKNHPVKVLMRWFRRCTLLSAMDRRSILNPFEKGGGSFTGPFTVHHAKEFCELYDNNQYELNRDDIKYAFDNMRKVYLEHVDELPHHFQLHFMHAAQIVGVHHSQNDIRKWWKEFYLMIVNDMHLQPETDENMNRRLSDNEKEWRAREEVTAT